MAAPLPGPYTVPLGGAGQVVVADSFYVSLPSTLYRYFVHHAPHEVVGGLSKAAAVHLLNSLMEAGYSRRQRRGRNPLMLHAEDLAHASPYGQYLDALVMYSTIFRCQTYGLSPENIDAAEAVELQVFTDGLMNYLCTAP